MEVNQNEWLVAKGIILSLADSFSPNYSWDFGVAETSKLADHILANASLASSAGALLSHAIRLIPTLKKVQKEIDHWIHIFPSDSKEERRAPDSIQRFVHQSTDPGGKERDRSSPLTPPSEMKTTAGKALLRPQQMIEEVRGAIQNLSSPSSIDESRSESFRVALSKLKPLIDDLIEALSQNALDPHQEGSFSPFKPSPDLSLKKKEPRLSKEKLEVVLQKIPPPLKEKPLSKMNGEKHEKVQEKRGLLEVAETSYRKDQLLMERPISKEVKGKESALKTQTPSTLSHSFHEQVAVEKGEERPEVGLQRNERSDDPIGFKSDKNEVVVSLSKPNPHAAIPFPLPTLRPLSAQKKKKRKRYFFHNESEEESTDSRR